MKKNLLVLGIMILSVAMFAQTPRLSLYEEFTGENCPPCASTNPGLNAKLLSATNATKIVAIKWQVPIPSAPSNMWSLYRTNQTEIDWRYRSTANGGYGYIPQVTYAPFGKIDGQSQAAFGATGSSADHPANLTDAMIATAQSYTSAFAITMNREWNNDCSAVTLTVNITASAPYTTSSPLVFRCVLVERLITFSVQPGTNGEKIFHDAARKSYPSLQAGTPLPGNWTLGQSTTFTLNCVLPSYIQKKTEIAFVGFIQNEGTQKVEQACRAEKAPLPYSLASLAANVGVSCDNSITPEIEIENTGSNPITSINIIPYIDNVAGTPIPWTGNIPVGTSTTIALPAITPATTLSNGMHTFSYNITGGGSQAFNFETNNSKANFMVAKEPLAEPVSEGFVLGAFPPSGWANINKNNGVGFGRTTQVGGYFQTNNSVKYPFYDNNVIGDKDELILPPMNLEGGPEVQMTFDYAYTQRNENSNDMLEVMVSDDCGANWTTVWSAAGMNLMTAPSPTGQPYIPTTQDLTSWNTAVIDLPSYNKSNVLAKFVVTNDNGNNLYIDNVNLAQKNPTGLKETVKAGLAVNIYPNPVTNAANVSVFSETDAQVNVVMMNAIGQVVYNRTHTFNSGANTIGIDTKDMAAGVYSVAFETKAGSVVKKVTVTK